MLPSALPRGDDAGAGPTLQVRRGTLGEGPGGFGQRIVSYAADDGTCMKRPDMS